MRPRTRQAARRSRTAALLAVLAALALAIGCSAERRLVEGEAVEAATTDR
jgi:hypothetical protein